MKRSGITRKPFVRKHHRLKNASKKRAKRNREVKDFRQAFALEIGCCELCGTPSDLLDLHEISGGWARAASLDKRYAILVLDRTCHDTIELETKLWTVARQAALLKLRRPNDFDLPALNRLLTRQVCEEEVALFDGRVFNWR